MVHDPAEIVIEADETEAAKEEGDDDA